MASPSTTQVLYTLQAALDEFWQFSYDTYQFIGTQVFPVIESNVAAGPFGLLPLEEMLKREVLLERAPGSGYSRDRAKFTNDEFRTREYGREELVDDNDRETWASFHNDPDSFATQRAVNTLMRAREQRVSTQLFDNTIFSVPNNRNVTPGAVWTDWINATPIVDVEAAAQKVFDNSGMWPNAVVMNRKAFRNVRNCDSIVSRISSQGAGDQSRATDVTTAQLAEVFDVDMVLVAGGAKNTAAPGVDNAVIEQLWGKSASVCRIATSQDMKEPCIGRTVHWAQDGSSIDGTVERYRSDPERGDVIRVRHQTDEKLLYADLGCLIENVYA